MEVSVHIARYIAVLGNTTPSVRHQPSHGYLSKQLLAKETMTQNYGAIQRSIEKFTEHHYFSTELKISFKEFAVQKIPLSLYTGWHGDMLPCTSKPNSGRMIMI